MTKVLVDPEDHTVLADLMDAHLRMKTFVLLHSVVVAAVAAGHTDMEEVEI